MVVAAPGWLRSTTAVDVRLRAVRHLTRPIRHNLEVTFHTGSSETEGRLLLLDCDELSPGRTAWAQVRLTEPAAALKGDHFIIRDPNDTLGGGAIIDTHVRRHRRFHSPTIAALGLLAEGTPEEVLLTAVAAADPVELAVAARKAGLADRAALAAAQTLMADGRLVSLDGAGVRADSLVCTNARFESLMAAARATLAAYHAQSPLRRGMPREELRSRLKLPARSFDPIVAAWVDGDTLDENSGSLALPDHRPEPDAKQARPYPGLPAGPSG